MVPNNKGVFIFPFFFSSSFHFHFFPYFRNFCFPPPRIWGGRGVGRLWKKKFDCPPPKIDEIHWMMMFGGNKKFLNSVSEVAVKKTWFSGFRQIWDGYVQISQWLDDVQIIQNPFWKAHCLYFLGKRRKPGNIEPIMPNIRCEPEKKRQKSAFSESP